MPRIVEIDDVQSVTIYQDIAGMKIGVQTQLLRVACTLKAAFDSRKQLFGNTLVRGVQLERNVVVLQQKVS